MRIRRLLLICALTIGLAPGTLLRTHFAPDPITPQITVTPLDARSGVSGELPVTGAWELSADHRFFGGFSALVLAENGGLLFGSDRGWSLDLPIIAGEPRGAGALFVRFARYNRSFDALIDLEGMTRDPETGTLWTAFETHNVIQRDRANGTTATRQPAEMREWSSNSGPETLLRLADGRFIVLAEAAEASNMTDRPGLLFASDPIEDRSPTQFRLATPPDYAPVDATQLPDGSVLILLRRVQINFPADFDATILRADPSQIEAGGIWSGDIIANFAGATFGENFEGITFVPRIDASGGAGDIYLIADDNLSLFQRNLLVRLAWNAGPTAAATDTR